ncbi:T9SS type A sorting domain-containing protein [Leeuwenhoekiella sp. UBA1003]|uniref:T9SS type A sorting domain-containing protein n=1 Tax=Leeuwenhoekiella sp. UBA1003 TaxID=1946744 RepID=UPI0025BC1982|nr:T9SS type A sorting domain-containing protein [Leeuwenhoekiella sp. UBA1003]
MKKITLFIVAAFTTFVIKAQCGLNDNSLFVGDYFVQQLTEGAFEMDLFDPTLGDGHFLTLYSEVTDASQVSPGIPLALTQRSFDAIYLPDLGFLNERTYIFDFLPSCQATFTELQETGLECTEGVFLGFAEGGDFQDVDDSQFTMVVLENATGDCAIEGVPVTLLFTRADLSVPQNALLEGFDFYVSDNQLFYTSKVQSLSVAVYDILGKQILSNPQSGAKGSMNMQSFSPGIYLAKFSSEGTQKTVKFVVH